MENLWSKNVEMMISVPAEIQVMLQWADVKIILETCFKSDCSKLQLQMYSMQEISHQVGNYKTDWCNTSVAKLKMGVLKMLQGFSTELQRAKILWLKLVFTMWEVGWSLLFQTTKHILLHTKAKEWKYYFGREKKSLSLCSWKQIWILKTVHENKSRKRKSKE